jgi:hypothetical protein
MRPPPSLRARLNLLGAAILVLGLGAAAWIWIHQDRIDRQNADLNADQVGLLDSRSQTRQLEVLTGHSGVVAEQWAEWLKSLAHGKRLAATLAIISAILGVGCMVAGDHLLPYWERGKL